MIVADTNLVAYLLIDGKQTDVARAVWKKDPHWMLPTIWRSEFLNILTVAVRAQVITLEQAHETWEVAVGVFGQSEVDSSGDDVLNAAARRKLSAYDAQFAVAASDLRVPLITFDRRLLRGCRDFAVSPERFLA